MDVICNIACLPLPLEQQKMILCRCAVQIDVYLALLMLSYKTLCILDTRLFYLLFIKKMLFPSMTVVGILGNMSVSVNYMFSWWGSPEKKLIHIILIHLAFTNIILLLAKRLPKTKAAFGLRNFLDAIGCKIIVYLERMARGLSICTSSLLTVVQAVIISPRASGWRKLRPKSAWHILPFFSFFWILNASISVNLIHSTTNTKLNVSQLRGDESDCYFMLPSQKIKWIFLPLMVLRDAVFQGAMGGASGYMVFLLYKHHQHVLYLQNSKLLYRTPPELRAAQSVLLLMLCFVFFYWTDCAFSLIINISLMENSLIINIQEFLTLGYATFSPLVLIHRDGVLTGFWHVHLGKLRKCRSFTCSISVGRRLSVLQYYG
uniref:Vomeronasal type-1 receptor n=1 Tax=Mus spicilegus TaxID=10103 RepID=A0A8C6G8S8_MUSSI